MLIELRPDVFLNTDCIYCVTIDEMPVFPVLIETTLTDDEGVRESFRISLERWKQIKPLCVPNIEIYISPNPYDDQGG